MPFARRTRRMALAGAALTAATIAGAGGVWSQTATDPLLLKKPVAAAPTATAPTAAPKAAAKPAQTTVKPAPAATAAKPVPPAGLAVKPAAGAKPVAKAPGAVKPAGSPAAEVAQKVNPAARRAAALAALTAQATPPVHNHVFKPAPATACANPDAIGISRVLEVDTTGGLYLGQRYMSGKLPLEPKEVVLTFDDGPMPRNTDRVLEALANECTKASFFIVGAMAKAHPETLRKIAQAGHTVGYHTMTHPLDMVKRPVEWGKDNISSGWKTVDTILYGKAEERPATPFFRYPGLFNSYGINTWLNSLDVGVFAIDAAGNDWLKGYLTATDAPNVMNEALKELEKTNGGILLLHDIKESSSRAVAPLLHELKVRGFKIVHIVPKRPPPPLADHLATGSVAPMAAAEPLPVGQRSLAGFDTQQQLIQGERGFTGRLPGTAMPSAAVAIQPQPTATLQQATHTVSPAAATPPVAGATASTARERSIADVIGADVDRALPSATAGATDAAADSSWLGATGRSFRGIASAIGIW